MHFKSVAACRDTRIIIRGKEEIAAQILNINETHFSIIHTFLYTGVERIVKGLCC